MISAILSACAGATSFAASVALHSKVIETPSGSLAMRLALDAAGFVAICNSVALLAGRVEGPEQIAGATFLACASLLAFGALTGGRDG